MKQCVWVYLGTGVVYGEVELSQLHVIERNPKTNQIQKVALMRAGMESPVILEYISKEKQAQRLDRVCVRAGTSILFREEFQANELENIIYEPQSWLIKQATLMRNGVSIPLEWITRNAQRARMGLVWVYAGTGKLYQGTVDSRHLCNVTFNYISGEIERATLIQDGTAVFLEQISNMSQQRRAAMVCVYADTGVVYPDVIDLNDLYDITRNQRTGENQRATLNKLGMFPVTLEWISQNTQRKRALVCVRAGTSCLYTEPVELSDLVITSTYPKSGAVHRATLIRDKLDLEWINVSTLKRRENRVWLYVRTSREYEYPFDLAHLTNTVFDETTGDLLSGVLKDSKVSPRPIALELVTRRVQMRRADKVWVYEKMALECNEPIDPSRLQNKIFDRESGELIKGTLVSEELKPKIVVELITRDALSGRKRALEAIDTGALSEISIWEPEGESYHDAQTLVSEKKRPAIDELTDVVIERKNSRVAQNSAAFFSRSRSSSPREEFDMDELGFPLTSPMSFLG